MRRRRPAAADASHRRTKRRPFLILGVVAGVMLLAIGGYLVLTAGEESTDDAQVAADMVPIGTRVAGQIVKVHVTENQLVKKGDVIVEIDDADYAARVKQAEAELASQRRRPPPPTRRSPVVEAGSRGRAVVGTRGARRLVGVGGLGRRAAAVGARGADARPGRRAQGRARPVARQGAQGRQRGAAGARRQRAGGATTRPSPRRRRPRRRWPWPKRRAAPPQAHVGESAAA